VEDPGIVAMGADAFVAGTHKWIFAPRGTGFVWARPEVWASMRMLVPTFNAGEPFTGWAEEKPPAGTPRGNWFSPGGFQAFEHWWALPAAFEFHRRIGSPRITERIHSLNEMAKNEMAKMPNVVLYTPRSRELSSGIVCFDVKGKTQAETVRTLLDRHKILASTSPYRVSYARIAFGIQNSEDEVERTMRAIRAI
jgi:isopenicillin-N epimerase